MIMPFIVQKMARPFQWSSMYQSDFPHRLSSFTCWSLNLVKLSLRKVLSMRVNYLSSRDCSLYGALYIGLHYCAVAPTFFTSSENGVCVWFCVTHTIRIHWFLFFCCWTRDHPLFVAIDYFCSCESFEHESRPINQQPFSFILLSVVVLP